MRVTKIYKEIPFAHKQTFASSGSCFFFHGHNWDIELTFEASSRDENNFIVDFGDLKFIKNYLETHLDHACVLSLHDKAAQEIVGKYPNHFKPYWVESPSSEGLAEHFFGLFNKMVKEHTENRVRVVRCGIREDLRNSAECTEKDYEILVASRLG